MWSVSSQEENYKSNVWCNVPRAWKEIVIKTIHTKTLTTTFVIGASGATGKLLVEQLLQSGQRCKIIIRSTSTIPLVWYNNEQIDNINKKRFRNYSWKNVWISFRLSICSLLSWPIPFVISSLVKRLLAPQWILLSPVVLLILIGEKKFDE